MEGWIKLYRKIWENPIVTKDPDYFVVWIHLLTHAVHAPCDTDFRGKRITLKPGQQITGRKRIAEETHVEQHKVYRILCALQNEQQIEQQGTARGSLISIVNWNQYQKSEQLSEQQNEQQVSTKEEYKECIYKERDKNSPNNSDTEEFPSGCFDDYLPEVV